MATLLAASSGCQRSAPGPDAAQSRAAGTATPSTVSDTGDRNDTPATNLSSRAQEVHLEPEQVQRLGIGTAAVESVQRAAEASGFALVVAHDAIAQSLADLRTAQAIARQSEAALQRARRLAGTAGAMPADALEAAERQSTVDQAALHLARQRLSSTYGPLAPWNSANHPGLLDALASGAQNLVRVSFPIGALQNTLPAHVRLGRIGTGQSEQSWESVTVWPAPADGNMPGQSLFVTLEGGTVSEGERLLAWAPTSVPQTGVLIPASAALIAGGSYWCYVERSAGTFVRTALDPHLPLSDGYFVTRGIHAGDRVVIRAAGQLLAMELGSASDAE